MHKINSTFWFKKRVLITGHTGFKGSWLSLWLQSLGASVFGFSLDPPTKPSLFEEARVGENMKSIFGDIRDFKSVSDVVASSKPEIVFHLAAQPLVRYSYTNPIETYSTNVIGTLHLFEAIRNINCVKSVVNVTSDKCYENNEWIWGYRENEPMGGRDPYSNSKGCSELITSSYRHSFFSSTRVALASARAGNVVGGGDWANDRLIPDILRAFENLTPALIRNPNSVRPWQHVLEPLSGYLILAEKLYTIGHEFAEGWNFGPNDTDEQSVKWIADNMAKKWGMGASWQNISGDSLLHEANNLKLNISKAKSVLGWYPVWNLDYALDKIIDWHKSWLKGDNMKNKCIDQINEYQQ